MGIHQGLRPIETHAPLWRYVRLKTLFFYLTGKAYVPSVRKLQECDRSEGLPICDHIWTTEGFTKEEYVELAKWVEEERTLTKSEKELFELNRRHAGANQRVYFEHYHEFLSRTRYAWCWYASAFESAAMWQLYGQDGVAIRTSVDKLGAALEPLHREWMGCQVRYINREPDSRRSFAPEQEKDLGWWIRRPYFFKGVEYEHEHEVRFVTLGPEEQDGIRLEGIKPETWIEEVVIWPGLVDSEADTLEMAIATVCPSIKERIRKSLLFQRDRTAVLSPGFEDAFENAINESWQKHKAQLPSVVTQL
jgi:hypothetical protein